MEGEFRGNNSMSNRNSEIGKQRNKENHYLKEYCIKIFPKWKMFLKEYMLRLEKTTTYLAEVMKTKHREFNVI